MRKRIKNNNLNRRFDDSIKSKYKISEKDILNMDTETIKEQWKIINDFLEKGDFQSVAQRHHNFFISAASSFLY